MPATAWSASSIPLAFRRHCRKICQSFNLAITCSTLARSLRCSSQASSRMIRPLESRFGVVILPHRLSGEVPPGID